MSKSVVQTSAVESFLSGHRIALVGASAAKNSFAAAVHRALVEHGYEVVPVHRTASTFEGVACHPDLASVPGELDGVLVMVHRSRAADVVRACAARGVRRVWLFQGIGQGAVSEGALAVAREHGIEVVAGACPLMFLEPVGFGHRLHRAVRRANRSLART